MNRKEKNVYYDWFIANFGVDNGCVIEYKEWLKENE